MEQILEHTLLYDFYGELLTDHQKEIYEDAYFNDLSLSEVAEEYGISRQGVHDLLKRCNKILQDYEDKLHLVERFIKMRKEIAKIDQLVKQMEEKKDASILSEIKKLTDSLLETV